MSNNNEVQVVEDLSVQLMSDEGMYNRVNQMADMMSKSLAIPEHLRGDHGACFNVTIQAIQWKMNPFAVAQKTHSIKGNIGYEAQLINAVINAHAPTVSPLNFEFFGPWENILGKFDTLINKDGKKYNKSTPNAEREKGCGVKAWATLKGEDEPRVVELYMAQCPVRNSTNWANDPQQQLVYMAQKKWARRFCPEVILGVYSADEMPATQPKKQSASDILSDLSGAGETVEVKAEVVTEAQSESISVEDIVKAIALPKEQILTFFLSADAKIWQVKASLSELSPSVRADIVKSAANAKAAIEKFSSKSSVPKINADQVKRLQTIKSASGKTEEYFKQYLESMHGLKSSKDILAGPMYDEICNWLEKAPNSQQ